MTNKDICETALSFVGKLKYKFGGDNIVNGYGDCSDFTQYVYNCYGIDIGGTTNAQYTHGYPSLASDQIIAGDLVFFKNTYKSNYTDGVSHVGIALGDNKFVHLSNSGCKVSDLGSGYYADHYLGARRVTGVANEITSMDVSIADTAEKKTTDVITMPTGVSDILRLVVVTLLLVAGAGIFAASVGVNLKGVSKL